MRAKRILNQSTSKKILIATLNRALANLIDSVMKELLDDEEYDRLDVLSLLIVKHLRKFEPRNEKIIQKLMI